MRDLLDSQAESNLVARQQERARVTCTLQRKGYADSCTTETFCRHAEAAAPLHTVIVAVRVTTIILGRVGGLNGHACFSTPWMGVTVSQKF